MHDELRKIKQLDVRNCNLLRYSRGGQYLLATNKQFVHIFNAYTFVELQKVHTDSAKIVDIVFAELDKAFAVLGVNGYIGKWRLPTFEKIHESTPGNLLEKAGENTLGNVPKLDFSDFKAIDFIPNPPSLSSNLQNHDDFFSVGVVGSD